MRTLIFAAAVAAFSSAASAQEKAAEAPGPIHLVCQGERHYTQQERTSVSISRDYRPADSSTGVATTSRQAVLQGEVQVIVDGGAVRIEPSAILLNTNSILFRGPKDGWYTLDKVVIDPDQFAGRLSITFYDKPEVRIDRHTGAIRISGGLMDFRGACEKSAPITAQKF
jgi:hypothetical protein